MNNYKALYQEVILDHNKKPRNFGTLAHATHSAEGHNPLCGDHLSVALTFDCECIDCIAFQGESCAICKASASMMTTAIKGKTPQQHRTASRIFRCVRPTDARQMRDFALAHPTCRVQFGRSRLDRSR
jgi:nitrogen fixation NifU-like protein